MKIVVTIVIVCLVATALGVWLVARVAQAKRRRQWRAYYGDYKPSPAPWDKPR